MAHGKFYSTKEIAEMFGFKVETVRNLCSARAQRFARRLVPGGRYYIELTAFEEYLERLRRTEAWKRFTANG